MCNPSVGVRRQWILGISWPDSQAELEVQGETQSPKIRRVMEKGNGHWLQVSAHTHMSFFSVHLHTIHNTHIQTK